MIATKELNSKFKIRREVDTSFKSLRPRLQKKGGKLRKEVCLTPLKYRFDAGHVVVVLGTGPGGLFRVRWFGDSHE